jgi:regulatory protein
MRPGRKPPRRPTTSDSWTYLVRLLKVRPRSEHEARSRLEGRGYAKGEIEQALALAKDAGMIDDSAFARLWVGDRVHHHPLSRRAVARELEEKGVPKSIAEAALAEHYPPPMEKDLIWRLARERYERLSGVDQVKRERRTVGFLTRRGFSLGLACGVVRQLAKGETDA